MINLGVVDRYSKALFDLSEELKSTKEVLEQFQKVNEYFMVSDELISFLQSKKINIKEKVDVIEYICDKENVCELLRNFLVVMVRGKRGTYVKAVFASYGYRVKKSHGIYSGIIKSSRDLSESEVTQLSARVSKVLNKNVEFQVEVDKSIIGGVSIMVEGVVYKDDLKFRVESLKEWMKG